MKLVELDDSINGELDSPTDLKAATVHCEYRDAVGRKTAEIDASGRITRFGYDGLGRLIVVVLPNPATGANPALVNGSSPDAGTLNTRYAYDEVGNKIRQTDAEGRETRWEFDAMGRETARAHSTPCRSPVPAHAGHRFHAIPVTCVCAAPAPREPTARRPGSCRTRASSTRSHWSIGASRTPPSSKAYAGLSIADRTHRADFLQVLRNVTRFVDTACAGKPGIPITPKIRQAIRQFGWSF